MDYTVENINSLISSINNNTEAMRGMLIQLRDNCVYLNKTMADCAKNHIRLTDKQVKAFREYMDEYDRIKRHIDSSGTLLETHSPIKLLSDVTSIISFCSRLLAIHHDQLQVIDRLCALIQKSDTVLELIA